MPLRDCFVKYYTNINVFLPVCFKTTPKLLIPYRYKALSLGQIVERLSLIASGRYLSHRLNFILSKQHRSPATESRNPGAPGLNQECQLLDVPWSTNPNLDLRYHRALLYKNKHYNKSSIYDRMKFKIKSNLVALSLGWEFNEVLSHLICQILIVFCKG